MKVISLPAARPRLRRVWPVIFLPLLPVGGPVANFGAQAFHQLDKGGLKRVVAAFGENIRAGCDEMSLHLKSRACIPVMRQGDDCLLNLERWLQRDDLLLDP